RFFVDVAKNERSFQNLEVTSITATEPVFTAPVFRIGRKGVADTGRDPGLVGGVELRFPEIDALLGRLRTVAEQRLQAVVPGELAASYIPIPNRIVRSPGKV